MSFDYLHPNVMMHLYCQGAFPMADEDSGELNWYCPEERTVITMDNYNIPKSLQQFRRQMPFTLRCNTRFEEVVRGCADRSETWISEPLIEAYLRLHALGFAHSVETFEGERLVGGLYGISFKGAFFGEFDVFSRFAGFQSGVGVFDRKAARPTVCFVRRTISYRPFGYVWHTSR